MAFTPPPSEPPGVPPSHLPPPPPPLEPPSPEEPPPALLPFEQPGYPFLEGLYETAKLVITEPTQAFTRVRFGSDLGRPLLYAVIFGWIGIIASQVYEIALRGTLWQFLPWAPSRDEMFFSTGMSVALMVAAPIFVLLGVFVAAVVIHLFLLLVGGGGAGLTTTVKVVCYASTVQISQVVPVCGGLVGGLWALVLYIIGLAAAHRISQGKAALAVLLPLLLCCLCAAAVVALFGAAIWGAIAAFR